MSMPVTYAVYLVLSAAVTIGVAHVLHKRGRVFLVEMFHHQESIADSVNDLLVVGFYLVNFGYVTLALKFGSKPETLTESIEFLSTKVGLVLLILGAMHFLNLAIFARIGCRKTSTEPSLLENNLSTNQGANDV